MGGTCAKEVEPQLLTSQEHRFIESCFKTLSHDKENLKRDDLQVWNYLADPDYVRYTRKACFRHSEQATIKLKTFARHFYVVVKGSAAEKAAHIVNEVFSNTDDLLEKVTTVQMLAFVTSILRSYCIVLNQNKESEFTSWNERGVVVDTSDLRHYSHFMIGGLADTSSVGTPQLERWLNNSQMFCHVWREVLVNLCNHMNAVIMTPYPGPIPLPECRVSDRDGPIHSILSVASVMFINELLPAPYRRTWTLLFSSKLHGENFTFLITKIVHQGPTIVLVKDDCDHLFGGFAKTSWALGPNFHGDEGTLLFTLQPNMCLYRSSGLNNHYQYLNMNQQTMPNGLGMGGQFNYWGLWLDANFTKGQSAETCTTFSGFQQMSGRKLFQVRHVEVWSVCERLVSLGAITSFDHDTVLLSHSEDKCFLRLAGHSFRSDGDAEEPEPTK